MRSKTTSSRRSYWVLTYLVVLINTYQLLPIASGQSNIGLYPLVLWLTYSVMYLALPVSLVSLIGRSQRVQHSVFFNMAVVALPAIVNIALFADRTLFQMYGFHINGFVWNLLTTRGGIESLGAGPNTVLSFAGIAFGFTALQIGFWFANRHWLKTLNLHFSRVSFGFMLVFFIATTATERVYFGISDAQGNGTVINAAYRFPLYLPLTFRSLAAQAGIATSHNEIVANFRTHDDGLQYPLRAIEGQTPNQPPDIIWLVAESLRADMLTPELMPNTWQFAQNSTDFRNHYSGSNGTRMGIFSMFYGLYSSYWHTFLSNGQRPVLMQRLNEMGYQFCAQTSAHFSYPEFDRTVFAGLDANDLHEDDNGKYWARDRRNVTRGIEWLTDNNISGAKFYFQFFESPHARYYFPEESVTRQPYLAELNYATMDTSKDMPLIKNRYINAVNHLDQQLARMYETIRTTPELADAIVIVTGDHGEEFMEKGNWGHNSEFTQEQIRVPLLIRVPGKPSQVVEAITSHLDIPATLMALLGATNDPSDYSLGQDLFGASRRKHTVVGDWSRIAYIDESYKLTASINAGVYVKNPVLTTSDLAIPETNAVYQQLQGSMMTLLEEMGRFYSKPI